ncbi:hypothetical protein [Chondromyces crocatus]|uniref:Uncharacterized protein n=1 Tax=Chondromyces crocatus TaxID=52 RepID=A0A0K1ELD4_CHOCO|nr:hypothetical protein [Chondromyces crocatus]AKT41487.1 uncharacterized protein CMC5_056950 [Chondromyces crocatus]
MSRIGPGAAWSLTFLALGLGACGGPVSSPVAPVVLQLPSAEGATSGSEGAAAVESDETSPPRIELPSSVACVLDGPVFPDGDAVLLRLQEGGPPFAEVRSSVDARVHLAAGRPLQAVMEVDADGLLLRGRVNGEAIPLRPARALPFRGFAVPLAFTLFHLEAVAPGKITLGWSDVSGVKVLGAPLVEQVTCSDVTLGIREFDASSAAGPPDSEREALLSVGKAVPLSLDPGGPAVAELRAEDDDDAKVTVVGSAGAHERVLWWRDEALIMGWIPAAKLRQAPPASGALGTLSAYGSVLSATRERGEVMTCPRDVPLIAEVMGERATVGTARAGFRLELLARSGGYADVLLVEGGVWLSEGARLLARTSDLIRCRRAGR